MSFQRLAFQVGITGTAWRPGIFDPGESAPFGKIRLQVT